MPPNGECLGFGPPMDGPTQRGPTALVPTSDGLGLPLDSRRIWIARGGSPAFRLPRRNLGEHFHGRIQRVPRHLGQPQRYRFLGDGTATKPGSGIRIPRKSPKSPTKHPSTFGSKPPHPKMVGSLSANGLNRVLNSIRTPFGGKFVQCLFGKPTVPSQRPC